MDYKLNNVNPDLAARVTKIILAMNALGFSLTVVQGFRTAEYQHSLWLKGRDPDGNVIDAHKIVTNCDGIKNLSNHQKGLAVDCAFIGQHDEVSFDSKWPWSLYGEMGKALGLKWGGDFKLRDLDHLEMP